MTIDGKPVSLRSQLAAVEQLRQRYASDPKKGTSWGLAELTLDHLDAAIRTLRWLEANEAKVKRAIVK